MRVSHKELLERVHYDPETGIFTSRKTGKRVGNLHPNGYVNYHIKKRLYLTHRLAWFYMTKKWPKETIDHINCIRHDNRFCNLREATHSQNSANCGAHRDCKTGMKGVTLARGKWRVHCMHKHIGVFSSKEEAAQAYLQAAQQIHKEFARA